jgi:hypothetical protein
MATVSPATARWAHRAAEDAGLIENGVADFAHLALFLVRVRGIASLDDIADLAESDPLACEFLTGALADFAEFIARTGRPRSGGLH